MKNVFKIKACATVVCTCLLVLSSSFSYGNNTKQRFDPLSDIVFYGVIDLNHNGYLDASDLYFLVSPSIADLIYDELLAILDTNVDGKIDNDEFAPLGTLNALKTLLENFVKNIN